MVLETKQGSFLFICWRIVWVKHCAMFYRLCPHLRDVALRANVVPKQQVIRQSQHPISGILERLDDIPQDCLQSAEKYLVQVVYRGNPDIETMDHIRRTMYHHRKSTIVLDLPPTCYSTRTHILRALYASHIQVNWLQR